MFENVKNPAGLEFGSEPRALSREDLVHQPLEVGNGSGQEQVDRIAPLALKEVPALPHLTAAIGDSAAAP